MKAYFGGLPTSIDIRKIDEQLGILKVGDEIEHERMENILGIRRDESRYRTVTLAWRKARMRDGLEIGAVPSIGFRVLNERERVDGGVKGAQQGMRKTLRAVKRTAFVKTDDPGLVKKQDLLRRLGSAISAEATSVMREIEPPKPALQIPRQRPSV